MLPEIPLTVVNSMQTIAQAGILNQKIKCEQYYCPNMPCVDPLLALPPITTVAASAAVTTTKRNNDDMMVSKTDELYAMPTCAWNQQQEQQQQQQHYFSCNCMQFKNAYQDTEQHYQHMHNQQQQFQLMQQRANSDMLLQGSDDPLIGHGANTVINDDDQAIELNSLLATAQQQQQQQQQQHNTHSIPAQPSWSSIIKQKLKDKASLMSAQAKAQAQLQLQVQNKTEQRRVTEIINSNAQVDFHKKKKTTTTTTATTTTTTNGIKLRFHHQALPAEYLSHYEATQGQGQINQMPQQQQQQQQVNSDKRKEKTQKKRFPANKTAQENVRTWLKNIVEIQKNAQQKKQQQQQHQQQQQQQLLQKQDEEIIEKTDKNCTLYDLLQDKQKVDNNNNTTTTTTKMADEKIVCDDETKCCAIKFTDLPYMGEITLDNSRPRRGRKPKKANICHLIYKNYGTIILGEPKTAKCNSCDCNSTICNTQQQQQQQTATTATTATTTTKTMQLANQTLVKDLTLNYDNKNANKITINNKHNNNNDINKNINNNNTKNNIKLDSLLPLNLCLRDQLNEKESTRIYNLNTTSTTNNNNNRDAIIHKRKRSALFIPPKPAEHALSPANEVSICKFKFTGGAKPLLQEKKMLSVDADGNYRYFSGNNYKILYTKHNDANSAKAQLDNNETAQTVLMPDAALMPTISTNLKTAALSRKRKLTRRSEQRERLEKTFKEKGFLIQTQQLQSAEGATYCKFRQLKKFTRYLFRNWKDYLPNELQQQQQQQQAQLQMQLQHTNVITAQDIEDSNS